MSKQTNFTPDQELYILTVSELRRVAREDVGYSKWLTDDDVWEIVEGMAIYAAVYEAIQEFVGQKELAERNRNAKDNKPYFVVRRRNMNSGNAQIYDSAFRDIAYFKTENDAEQFMRYENKFGNYLDEQKVEKVE